MMELLKGHFLAFPDWKEEIEIKAIDGDIIAYLSKGTGTQTGQAGQLPPKGRKCELEHIIIHRFEKGKIAETWVSWDNLSFLVNLGIQHHRIICKYGIMKYFFIAIIFFSISCNTKEQKADDRIVAVNKVKKLGTDLIKLWETGDTLRTEKIFLKECTYSDVANNQVFSGIHEINKYISHIHSWASEIEMTKRNIKVSNETGYIEWTLSAKQTKPIEGRIPVASNNIITLKGVSLIEVKNGKIEKASDYMDVLGFVIQLGGKIELPGGMVIGEQKKDLIE